MVSHRGGQAINLQTWVRIKKTRLATLSVGLGNATMRKFEHWPPSGEGRRIKEATERISRALEHVGDRRDLGYSRNFIEIALGEFEKIRQNSFFQNAIAPVLYQHRGLTLTYDAAIEAELSEYRNLIAPLWPEPPKEQASGKPVLSAVEGIIPDQLPGPLQFEFIGGRLQIKFQQPGPAQLSAENLSEARERILLQGELLTDALEASNCDGRLRELIEDVQGLIRAQQNAIQLGIANLTCERVFKRFEGELPDIVSGRWDGYSAALSLYVAQFPEWQEMLDNAAEAELSDADARVIYEAGQRVAKELDGLPEVAPEVPRYLQLVFGVSGDPWPTSRRALVAAVRTLQNFVSGVFREVAKVGNSISDGANTGIRRGLSAAIGIGIVWAAIHAATAVSPTLNTQRWMAKAAKIAMKELQELP